MNCGTVQAVETGWRGLYKCRGKLQGPTEQRRQTSDGPSEIGPPTNVHHQYHVRRNQETGQLEGLPESWKRLINTQISKQEQNENPDATLQAIRFYSYSMKKKHTELFKPFLTEKEIKEEDEEILGCETSSKEDSLHSESSDNSGVILSTSPVPLPEKKRPPVPPKKPNTLVSREKHKSKVNAVEKRYLRNGKSSTTQNTFAALDEALNNLKMNCIGPEVQTETDKGKQETETESPILRKKERVMHKMTDEEVFVELRRICHPGDPYKRFERSKELGAG
ncbi:unnamed protein product [Timema podura]|uniref:non-specific serine/threonine protein kinase n=1 Tax=Timema podura TaxID=61482 RepID=A0ABN7NQ99_TIMPD|nr:unnamed protein product [Timema podura]